MTDPGPGPVCHNAGELDGTPACRFVPLCPRCRRLDNDNRQICWSSRYLLADRVEFQRRSETDSQQFCRYTPAISVIFAVTLTLPSLLFPPSNEQPCYFILSTTLVVT